jgi:hypothetical protein
MDFGWALEQVRAGKKVKRAAKPRVVFFLHDAKLCYETAGRRMFLDELTCDYFLAMDWEHVEDPKGAAIDQDRLWKSIRNAG